jgi:DNA polymerase
VNPAIILAVGRIAAQLLLDTETPVGRLRGTVHQLDKIPLVVTYHPAYLLRSPSQKRKSWDDLCLARQIATEAAA